jgi:hypothetical protein
MPVGDGTTTTHPTGALFLRLWSKAVGTEDYDKAEWRELQEFVNAVLTQLTPEEREALGIKDGEE